MFSLPSLANLFVDFFNFHIIICNLFASLTLIPGDIVESCRPVCRLSGRAVGEAGKRQGYTDSLGSIYTNGKLKDKKKKKKSVTVVEVLFP